MQRLSDDTLLSLLHDLESDRVERKETFKGDVPKKARQAVCAFANDLSVHDAPGVLFIGARDNGTSSGIEISDRLLLALSDMKTDGNILPLPVLSVEKRILDDAAFAVVTVQPSDMPPVKYDGRIWIRTGPRRAIANAQEERILTGSEPSQLRRTAGLLPNDRLSGRLYTDRPGLASDRQGAPGLPAWCKHPVPTDRRGEPDRPRHRRSPDRRGPGRN